MNAVVIPRFGGPEVLEWTRRDDPVPGPGQVRVAVRASALNRADLLQRRGIYPAPDDAPADVPGLEFAGRIDRCGPQVRTLEPGARVMGILGGGAHAECVVADEGLCLPIPSSLGWEEAAALPEAFVTAFDAVILQGRLARGESLLVTAAASGVGTAAVQIGRDRGARVVATSRSPDKRTRLADLGAHSVLDPGSSQASTAIREAAGGGGIDVVLDLLGAGAWPLHVEVLASRGRLVIVGLLAGSRTTADLAPLLVKRLTVIGSVLRSRPLEEKVKLCREFAKRVLPRFEAGALRPVIDRVMPMTAIARAHELMERNVNFGKIVLTTG